MEIEEINKKMINIISSRVGANTYDNYANDQVWSHIEKNKSID